MAIQLTDITPQFPTGRKYVDLFVLDRSMAWSPDRDCKAVVTVIGGGGSGAHGYSSNRPSGGSAGGLTQSDIITLSSSTNYTVTVGAGGANPASAHVTSSSTILGVAGGSSSFVEGSNINLSATGGGGGQSSGLAGAPGVGSGGLINYAGGAGGYPNNYSAGGGGAVNITGTAYSGIGHNTTYAAHGGAGCGGAPLQRHSSSSENSANSGGPGTLYSVIDFYYLIPSNYSGPTSAIGVRSTETADYYGQAGPFSAPPMFVGGSGGVPNGKRNGGGLGQQGGLFAGGGAFIGHSYCRGQAGDGGLFGGGGGASLVTNNTDIYIRPSKGGDGVVFVAVTEYL